MRQFFLETDPAQLPRPGDSVTLDREESHHLFTVLRGGRDAVLELVDGRGHRMTGRPLEKNGKLAKLEILTMEQDTDELSGPRLVLGCAVVKSKRFEWALEKAVELGVHQVVPLVTEFGVVDPRAGKLDRWRTIMIAAVKQSGRSWLPGLADPIPLKEFLGSQVSGPVFYGAVAGPDEPAPFWTGLLNSVPAENPASLTMLIGPEGGWSPAEMSLLGEGPARPVGMGPHVLRTETAAAAGMNVLQALRQEILAKC